MRSGAGIRAGIGALALLAGCLHRGGAVEGGAAEERKAVESGAVEGGEIAPEPPIPAWVQIHALPPTAPPEDRCAVTLTLPPRPAVTQPPPPERDLTGWVQFDPARPETIPPTLAPLLAPPDLRALPIPAAGGDPAARRRLAAVMAEAGRRKVRVAVWGDSQITPDHLTGGVRTHLQLRYGDGGYGAISPVRLWGNYVPQGVQLCTGGRWEFTAAQPGRNGVLFRARAPTAEERAAEQAGQAAGQAGQAWSVAWFQAEAAGPSRIGLDLLRQPGGGSLRVRLDSGEPLTVDTAGEGPLRLELPVGPGRHRLSLEAPPAGDGAIPALIAGADIEREGPGVVVDDLGVNGQKLSAWLRWDVAAMRPWFERRPFDVMVLSYGSNDGQDPRLTPERFRDEARRSVERARSLRPEAICVLNGPADRGWRLPDSPDHAATPQGPQVQTYVVWDSHRWINEILAEIAVEQGCASWSYQQAMGGPGSMYGWSQAGLLAPDLIHLTARGGAELGRRWTWAMFGYPPGG